MKKIAKTALIIGMLVLGSTTSFANNNKQLKTVKEHQIEFNLLNFCNYLENGNPQEVEGIYSSPDQRYMIALVKNDNKCNDFIGVVLSADNPHWKKGEVKFNFVKDEAGHLQGYYYNSSRDQFPVDFEISGDSLKTDRLQKLEVEEIKAGMIALL